jgi:hypothetical protein
MSPPVTGPALRRRAAALAVTATATAGLLAGCASSSSTSPVSPSTGANAAGSQTPGAAGAAAGSQTPGAAGAAAGAQAGPGSGGLATCRSAALRVTVNASQAGGAAGSTYVPVDFTNTSASPCGLYGYPGVSFVTAGSGAGRQIGAAAQENPAFGKVRVRLAAGGVAHAWLQVTQAGNYPAPTCRPVTAHWLRVFAPGQTAATYVNHAFAACSSASAPLLTVMPVRAGQGVQGSTP